MAEKGSDIKQSLLTMMDAAVGAAVLVALFAFAGSWLDQKFHTQPWLTIGGAFLGMVGGLGRMVIKALALNKEMTPDSSSKPVKPLSNTDEGEDG